MDCQDIFALPTTIQAFEICELSLSTALWLLFHPFTIPSVELMDLFWSLAECLELNNCHISVISLTEVYKDYITHFARLQCSGQNCDAEVRARISVITP